MKTNLNQKGFTLLELLIYGASLVILLGAIVYLLIQAFSLYKDISISPKVDRAGIVIVDRIIKDIRTGQSVDLGNSSFGTNNGFITIDSTVNSEEVQKFFELQNGQIVYQENSGPENFISSNDFTVSVLKFDQILTDVSQAIRVEIQITYETSAGLNTKTYTGLAILRHSYD